MSTHPTTPSTRGRRLLLLLGIAVGAFLLSLPWQRHQWAEKMRIDTEVRVQETRIRKLNRERTAQTEAEQRLRQTPDDFMARLNRATVLIQSGDIPQAAAQLKALEALARQSPQIADTLAGLYSQIGYYDRAMAMVRLTEHLAPGSPAALLRRGYLEFALGRHKKGGALFRQVAAQMPGSAEPHVALALSLEQSGDLKNAERELETARRLRPSHWPVILLLARNQASQRQYAEALETVQAALTLSPDEPQIHLQKAEILRERARVQPGRAGEDTQAALRAVNQALLLNPNSLDAHNLLGHLFHEAGSEAKALQEWERAYALNPAYPKLRFYLGRLLIRNGERERGLKLLADEERSRTEESEFNRLVIVSGSQPENVEHHRRLARWSMEHGRLSRAILEWEEVLTQVPGDKEAQRGLQTARSRRGDL